MMSKKTLPQIAAERRDAILRLLLAGVSRAEIAKQLGITPVRLIHDVAQLRQRGLYPKYQPKGDTPKTYNIVKHALEKNRVRGGRLGDIYGHLTPEAGLWLVSQVPDGSSVAEVVASIVTDAFHEEKQE
jgi:predicted ArsR family transcriptional regulator